MRKIFLPWCLFKTYKTTFLWVMNLQVLLDLLSQEIKQINIEQANRHWKHRQKLNQALACFGGFGVFFPKGKGCTKWPLIESASTSQKELAMQCLMYITALLHLRAQCIAQEFWLRAHNCHIYFPFYEQVCGYVI